MSSGGFVISTGVLIARGTGATDRIGDRVMIKSIQCKYEIQGIDNNHQTFGNLRTTGAVRVIVVQDTQTNGIIPSVDDIYRAVADGGAGNPTFIDKVRNITWTTRFKVLYDETTVLEAQMTSVVDQFTPATGLTTLYHHFASFKREVKQKYIKCNIPVLYDNTGGAITINNIRTNNLLVLVGCNPDFDTQSVINLNFRVRYTDQ